VIQIGIADMDRDKLIKRVQKLAKKQGIEFFVDKKKGKGSHYRVKFGAEVSTLQKI